MQLNESIRTFVIYVDEHSSQQRINTLTDFVDIVKQRLVARREWNI